MAEKEEYSQEELREMLKELLDLDHGLSEWEMNFLDNVSEWQGDFTEGQAKKIEELYNKFF